MKELNKASLEVALFAALIDEDPDGGLTPSNPAVSADRTGKCSFGSSLHNSSDDLIIMQLREGLGGYSGVGEQDAHAVSAEWAAEIWAECNREWMDWKRGAK